MTGGHIMETNMIQSLTPWFEIRSVGLCERDWIKIFQRSDEGLRLNHELYLLDRTPEVLTRLGSLHRLRKAYAGWRTHGWTPDIILVFNLSPVYSAFVRWLRRKSNRPAIVLLLADVPTLREKVPLFRRLRYRLKPMAWFEKQMLDQFDACVGVSVETAKYFQQLNRPWHWYPGGLDPSRAIRGGVSPDEHHIVFGYLGSLSAYAGLMNLLAVFEILDIPNHLHIAGGSGNQRTVEQHCESDPRLHYAGNLTPDDALRFAQRCDVLINPRTADCGNENNFPSKIFDYALAGRSILSGRLRGDRVLGDDALYFDPNDFDQSLARALGEVASISRAELRDRGIAIQERLLGHYTWAQRAPDLARLFLAEQIPNAR